MKRILLLLLLICTGSLIRAQVYNNEWIDYSKTYYKFRVGATGTVPHHPGNIKFNWS
jgi:hypothetical protein